MDNRTTDMNEIYSKASRHLARHEPIFKKIIAAVGACTLQPDPKCFSVLARSIVSQQISTKAANSIWSRLMELCGTGDLNPKKLAAQTDAAIRSCGISAGKLLSLRSLSTHFLTNPVLKKGLENLPDEEVHEQLIPIRGIGPWTVQMFLIFSLGRLDVWPVLDLGVRSALRDHFDLELSTPLTELTARAEPWRPYRTIAAWYLWRSKELNPKKK